MEIEDILKQIEKKRKLLLKEFSTNEHLEKLIYDKFNCALDKLISDVLGMKKTWGGSYEVMQWCPSRRETLPTLNYIKSDLGVAKVNEIITQLFGDFKLELNEREKTSMINEYKRVYKSIFKQKINELASEQAEKDAQQLMDEIIGVKEEEKYELPSGDYKT